MSGCRGDCANGVNGVNSYVLLLTDAVDDLRRRLAAAERAGDARTVAELAYRLRELEQSMRELLLAAG